MPNDDCMEDPRMKDRYQKPSVSVYSREDIVEMMGPLKTQYTSDPTNTNTTVITTNGTDNGSGSTPTNSPVCVSCSNVDVAPSAILQFKDEPLTVRVDTGGCTEFQQVEVSIPGSSPFVFYTFGRSDGTLSGTTWTRVIRDFQFGGERGVYAVEVALIDGGGVRSSTCSGSITIE